MKLIKKLEDLFAAAAFAEEGDVDTALEITGETGRRHKPVMSGLVCDGDSCTNLNSPPVKA